MCERESRSQDSILRRLAPFSFLVGKVRGVLAMHSTYAMLVKVVSEKGIVQYKKAYTIRACCMVYVCECTGGPLGPAACS